MSTEDALAVLAALADTDPAQSIETELRLLLTHKSNFVVGKAVALAESRNITSVAPELIKAFPYFMSDCLKRDPGCSAKLAIANCLIGFGEPAWDIFLAGVRHVQMEPAFGGPVDTAATLRAMCGRGLIAMGHHDAFRWHAALLADSEAMTRAIAVETLANAPEERSELLLRAKIGPPPDLGAPEKRIYDVRDPERGIEMDAFQALMKIAPDESFDFIAGYLRDGDPERVRAAALALGESRKPEALELLCERWRWNVKWEPREPLALAIALVRSDEAFQFLLDALVNVPEVHAGFLLDALAVFRETPARTAKVKHVIESRQSRGLMQAYRKAFEPPTE